MHVDKAWPCVISACVSMSTHVLQAVMLGPLLMAGLTDGSRQITANASNLAPLVSDVNTTGLVSLRALHPSMKPPGTPQRYLQHTGVQVLVATVSDSNAGAMAATFRVVQMLDRETVMLESMDRPGHYIQSDQVMHMSDAAWMLGQQHRHENVHKCRCMEW